MKRFILALILLALLFLVVFFVVESTKADEAIDTRQSLEWHAMTLANVDTSGTAQITKAQVDSFVVMADQTVATDFALTPYLTNAKVDTFTMTQAAPATLVQSWELDDDFLPNGLLWAMYQVAADSQAYIINTGLPPPGVPMDKNKLPTAWASAGSIFASPVMNSTDKLIVCYLAMPNKMTTDTSHTQVDPPLRRMIVVLAAADICKKLGRMEEEMVLRGEYAAFKAERLSTLGSGQ